MAMARMSARNESDRGLEAYLYATGVLNYNVA